jgi:hypothetical protein
MTGRYEACAHQMILTAERRTRLPHQGPWKVAFFLPGCRQARQDGGFSSSPGSQRRRCTGFLPESTIEVFTAMAAQDNARRPQAESPGASAPAARGSEVEVRSGEM